jgi:pimeloyl-ACP methyl ester carboxylesterase
MILEILKFVHVVLGAIGICSINPESLHMERQEKVKFDGSENRSRCTNSCRYLGVRHHPPAYLLLLLVAPMSLRTVAQSPKSSTPPDFSDLAMPETDWTASPSPTETAARVDRDVIENGSRPQRLIVIGFVGGFVRSNDQKHPEVQFAEYLREHYGSNIYAEVFGNHHGKEALHEVLSLLARDGKDNLLPYEKANARIIIYGHSWGAAETLVVARELGKIGIPVLLTIQVDSIAKVGRDDSTVPANVERAINLYQSRGPLHGRRQIFAADPRRTSIIGNLHMTYKDRSINCDNYPWYARVFNKPHHEIENDPRVWNLAASLIDSEVLGKTLTAQKSTSWQPRVK